MLERDAEGEGDIKHRTTRERKDNRNPQMSYGKKLDKLG